METINSINQNFKLNCNIIICYDFDEDNTLKAIKKSNLNKENIIFLKNKLKGAHGAVMTGIKESKSEFVLVIPADDNYNTPNLMKMYNFLKNEQIDVLCPDRFIESGSIVNGPFIKF